MQARRRATTWRCERAATGNSGRPGDRGCLTGQVIASPFAGWTVEDDLSPVGWFVDALKPLEPGAFKVRSVVPDGYPSYARLVHPAYTYEDATSRTVRIRDIDHPEQQGWDGDRRFTWQTGWPIKQQWTIGTPTIGTLDAADLLVLIEVLRKFTGTPDHVWALIWPGWGFDWSNELHHGATQIPVRLNPFALLQGTLSGLLELRAQADHTPSYWWPQDREWVVGTDLDDFCTYIAGSEACIATLLADTRLECHRASPDDLVYPKPYLPT